MGNENNLTLLNEVKLFKGIMDDAQNDLLLLIISESKKRLLGYINARRVEALTCIPDEIDYIIRDVSIKRFNKIDSEGTKSNSQEGLKLDWENSYFDEYSEVLDGYADEDKTERRGSIKFI